MRQTTRIIAAVLVLVLAAGCKLHVTSDLYSTDLRDVMAGTTEISTPTTMAFEVPGTDDCDEHTAKIRDIVAGIITDFAPKGCTRENMDSYLLADTQIPIVTSKEAWLEADALFGIMLLERPDPEHIGVAILLDTQKYEILTDRMDEEFSQTVDLAASKVRLVLNNDERNAVTFAVRHAFVDSKPALAEHEYTLGRRHAATIQLSDVATAYLVREGMAPGFTLKKTLREN